VHGFLQDPTGDRRFWPVDTAKQPPTKCVFNDLPGEVDQMWAEAYMRWQCGESLILSGELLEEAKKEQEEHRASDIWESEINGFTHRKVPPNWHQLSKSDRRIFWSGEFGKVEPKDDWIQRDRVCAQEIWFELFNGDLKYIKRTEVVRINTILDNSKGWMKHPKGLRFGPYGLVKGGYVKR